jgi:alkylation response protein AidB-like acyl-CoA dehydrogenase
MDFTLSEEHQMIRDVARDFAQNEIAPRAAHFDETGEFPYDTIMKMGAQGLMGIEVPEEYGGAGMDTLAM